MDGVKVTRLSGPHEVLAAAGGHPYARFAAGMATDVRGVATDDGVFWRGVTVFGRTGHVLGTVPAGLWDADDLAWVNLARTQPIPDGYEERETWDFRWTTGPVGPDLGRVSALGPESYEAVDALLDLAFPHTSVRPGHPLALRWYGMHEAGRLIACAVDRSTRLPDGGSPPWTVGVLGAVAVHPAHRGTGTGTALAQDVTAKLVAEHGQATLGLGHGDGPATRLYERCGYAGLREIRSVRGRRHVDCRP
jgi:GNAT superfamily N-acetyltransferase